MNEETRHWVEIGALQLAVVVVAAHLYYGLPRLVRQPVYASTVDPRPALFVLSAVAIVGGAIYVALGGAREPVYAAGIALMATFVLGWVWWHLTGHVGGLPWNAGIEGTYYETGPLETVVSHLREDRLDLVSKLAETALAVVLAVLLVDERRSGGGAGRAAGAETDD